MKKIILLVLLFSLFLFGCTDTAEKVTESNTNEEDNTSKESDEANTATGKTSANEGINEGDISPDFTLKGLDGKDYTLSSFRGDPVLIIFWTSTCPHCIDEMQEVNEFIKQYPELKVLAVNADGTDEYAKIFAEEKGITLPILVTSEADMEMMQKYQVQFVPLNVLVKPDGTIYKYQVGRVMVNELTQFLNTVK